MPGRRPLDQDLHFIDRHVGAQLRRRREQLGLSQKSLAKAGGVSPQLIHKYESGANRISPSRLYGFARHLNVPIAYFFEGMPAAGRRDPAPVRAATVLAEHDLFSRETALLVEAYYRIDPASRHAVHSLIRSLSKTPPG